MTFEEWKRLRKAIGKNTPITPDEIWGAAIAEERAACCKAIDSIDDGEAPEYRACQEAIMERSNVELTSRASRGLG